MMDEDVFKEYRKSDGFKLASLYSKVESCGEKDFWLINLESGYEFPVKVFCNLKSCDDPGCMEHRKDSFFKKHMVKINDIKNDLKFPCSFVFTGWVLDYPIDRSFVREKFKECCRIVKKYSSSKFSIHMEIKLRERDCYLHFHVLSDFIDLKKATEEWCRVVKYEHAVRLNDVVYYVCKYASKTPFFFSELHREFYHLCVYKLVMHRFGTKVKEVIKDKVRFGCGRFCQSLDGLYREVNNCFRQNPFNWIKSDYGNIYVGGSVGLVNDGVDKT